MKIVVSLEAWGVGWLCTSLCVFVPACVRACMSVCFSGLGILLSVNAGLCDLKSHLLN